MSTRLMKRPKDTPFMEIAILLFVNHGLCYWILCTFIVESHGIQRIEIRWKWVGYYASGLPTFLSP